MYRAAPGLRSRVLLVSGFVLYHCGTRHVHEQCARLQASSRHFLCDFRLSLDACQL